MIDYDLLLPSSRISIFTKTNSLEARHLSSQLS
jgi:hypothetical protein